MKLLIINSVCGIKSTGRICTEIANEIIKNGHEVLILYGREKHYDNDINISKRINTEFDVLINCVKHRLFATEGFNAALNTKRLVKEIERFSPDIIHLHNLHGYYLNVEILFNFLKTYNKKVVWTLHDCWSFTGNCSHYSFIGCNKWQNMCHNCPQLKEYPKTFIDKTRKNYIRKKEAFLGVKDLTIITPSEWLKKEVEKSFLSVYPIKVVNNGIDLNKFFPRKSKFKEKHKIEDKKIILGVASSWTARKGLYQFAELSKIISSEYLIVLVGVSESIAKKLPDNILCLGKTNSTDELAEIYSASFVFANLSFEETMGLTSIEALACGTPVVTYNATALPEFMNEDCGVVLTQNKPHMVYEAIQKLSVLPENCILNAQKYSKESMYRKYLIEYGVIDSE